MSQSSQVREFSRYSSCTLVPDFCTREREAAQGVATGAQDDRESAGARWGQRVRGKVQSLQGGHVPAEVICSSEYTVGSCT